MRNQGSLRIIGEETRNNQKVFEGAESPLIPKKNFKSYEPGSIPDRFLKVIIGIVLFFILILIPSDFAFRPENQETSALKIYLIILQVAYISCMLIEAIFLQFYQYGHLVKDNKKIFIHYFLKPSNSLFFIIFCIPFYTFSKLWSLVWLVGVLRIHLTDTPIVELIFLVASFQPDLQVHGEVFGEEKKHQKVYDAAAGELKNSLPARKHNGGSLDRDQQLA